MDNNVLTAEDIDNIKEALKQQALAMDRYANEEKYPPSLKTVMNIRAKAYRETLEKISFEAQPLGVIGRRLRKV